MIRIGTLLACQLILWFIVGGLNHALAAWQLQLFAGGLLLVYPALCMRPTEGLVSAMLGGLVLDASTPLPFGQTALLLGAGQLLLLQLRPRLAITEPVVQSAIAVLAGVALYAARTLLLAQDLPPLGGLAGRILWELAGTSLLAWLVTPWFVALQDRSLEFMRVALRERPSQRDNEAN